VFAKAFKDCAPATATLTQAMTRSTVLLAKETALKSYTGKMDKQITKHPRGMQLEELKGLHTTVMEEVHGEFNKRTIVGDDAIIAETWKEISDNFTTLLERYEKYNERRLEKALSFLAIFALIAVKFFLLDKITDYTCDWWSNTCVQISGFLSLVYVSVFLYIGYHVAMLYKNQGQMAAALAGGELGKEVMRLFILFCDEAKKLEFGKMLETAKEQISGAAAVLDSKTKKE